MQGDSLLSETLGKPHIYLLRGKKADQEATVRTGHGTTDWFQIEKGVHQGCMMSPCLFNLYAQYIIRNAFVSFSCVVNLPQNSLKQHISQGFL